MKNLTDIVGAQKILSFWKIRTIRNYVSKGKIPCVRIGSRVYFQKEELEAFAKTLIKKQKVKF